MWWFTHSLKIGALKLTYGGVTHLTQVVGVVSLLTWKVGQLVIYGASGEVTLTLNMVAKVTQVIIRCRGQRENPMLNHLVIVAVDEGRRWHIITLASDRTPILSHTDLAYNTSYRFAASRTVFPWVSPYLAPDRLRLLAHVYDSVASIHMTRSPG